MVAGAPGGAKIGPMAMARIGGRLTDLKRTALVAASILAALAAASSVIALVARLGVTHAAPVYLLAVVAVGMRWGTIPAVATSVAAFLAYDFLFVQPLYTFTIGSPEEWLNLLLFLAVAVAIGRLVAIQAEHAQQVAQQAREAQALFSISRALAETRTAEEAAPIVLARLATATAMDRIWFALGPTPAEEKTIADTAPGLPLPVPAWQVVLQRSPGDEPAHWARTHVAIAMGRRKADHATVHRVRVEASGETLGSVWALRAREEREPDRAETRILSAAADQLGQAVIRDRVDLERTNAEVARRGEAVKTALLDSVSHDLRTPLATIRAAAGSMLGRLAPTSRQCSSRTRPTRPREFGGAGSDSCPTSRSSSWNRHSGRSLDRWLPTSTCSIPAGRRIRKSRSPSSSSPSMSLAAGGRESSTANPPGIFGAPCLAGATQSS